MGNANDQLDTITINDIRFIILYLRLKYEIINLSN